MAGPFQPEYLILHDYGGTPGANPSFNPYHALVSGGGIAYRNPNDPYSQPAPHAYKLNPRSIGLSWGGPVGGMPSKDEFALLKKEYDAIKQRFPNIKVLSHGEAYQQTRGTGQQASKLGRGLEEAAWRKFLLGDQPYEPGTVSPQGPLPMSQRSLTAVAGHAQTQPTTTGAAQPMPTYKDVGGQAPQYMGPQAALSSQKLAQSLMQQGMNPGPMRHWTEALGSVLLSGVGGIRNDMAMKDMKEGQAAGNQALAAMLMGQNPSAQQAALSNPYSQRDAMDWLKEQKKAELKAQLAQASGSDMPANIREWQEVQKMTPEEYQKYLQMKRASTTRIGDTLFNKEFGTPVANVGENLRAGKLQEGLGAADADFMTKAPKVFGSYKSFEQKTNNLLTILDRAERTVGPNTAGWGSLLSVLPESEARALQNDIKTIEANLAFSELNDMRANSPTGGALGNVTERELDLLSSTQAALDQAQDGVRLKENLALIRNNMMEIKRLRAEAFALDQEKFRRMNGEQPPAAGPSGLDGAALQGRGAKPLLEDDWQEFDGVQIRKKR